MGQSALLCLHPLDPSVLSGLGAPVGQSVLWVRLFPSQLVQSARSIRLALVFPAAQPDPWVPAAQPVQLGQLCQLALEPPVVQSRPPRPLHLADPVVQLDRSGLARLPVPSDLSGLSFLPSPVVLVDQ